MSTVQLVLALLSPLLVALFTQAKLSAAAKTLVLVAVTSAVTVISAYFEQGQVWDADLIRSQLETFATAVIAYNGFYKHVGLTADKILPNRGIGPVA